MDRRSALVMAGLGVAVAAVPAPDAAAIPERPLPGPEAPAGPPAPPGAPGVPSSPAAAAPGSLGDEFNGPAGSAPDPALWSIAQRRELIKNPVFWDRPENMGQYRDDSEHVFLDGN